ncbi:acyl carrier protein [Buchnera aphidicola]|uniref:acyl carrier protein n=1 Tax=Buchnera aphidicola TaxID=9 RepID=UPI003464D8FC
MINIEKKIKKVISRQFDKKIEKLNNSTKLIDDLKADSLDIIEFFMSLEEEFNISIPDEEMEKIIDIQSAIIYVHKKIKKISDP